MAGVVLTRERPDWLAGMGPKNIEEFGAARHDEAALTAYLAREVATGAITGQRWRPRAGLATAGPGRAHRGVRGLPGGLVQRTALSTDIAGWRDDDLAFVTDWGFSWA